MAGASSLTVPRSRGQRPVLAFDLLAVILMGLVGILLTSYEHEDLHTHGLIMLYIAVVMLFASLGVYVGRAESLPGSTQEVELNDVANALIQALEFEQGFGEAGFEGYEGIRAGQHGGGYTAFLG